MRFAGSQGGGKLAQVMTEAQLAADSGVPTYLASRVPGSGSVRYTPVKPSRTAVDAVLDGIEFVSWIGDQQ